MARALHPAIEAVARSHGEDAMRAGGDGTVVFLPQSALGSKTPMQAMKQWYQEHPDLFHKRPYDRPGCDR